jgi:hypothetical protein
VIDFDWARAPQPANLMLGCGAMVMYQITL